MWAMVHRKHGKAPLSKLTADCQRKKGAWMKSTRAGRRLHAASGLSGSGSAAFGAKKSGMQSFRYSLSGCFISSLYAAALNVSACGHCSL